MKKTIKILSFFGTLVLFIFMIVASTKDLPVGAGEKKVTVDLGSGYLELCSDFFEGVKPVKITIAVDKYAGSGDFESNFKTYRYFKNNKDQGFENEDNYKFENIVVPETGTFAITVTVDGETCFSCCSGPSCSGSKGRPFYRGISTVINASSASGIYYVNPIRANCF
tara:strand:+ start:549 stop:1049 length:501 start_codon:yes stop_codon:yes gene_type:complete